MTAITIADLNNAKTDVDHIAAIATSVELTATDRLGHVKSTLAAAIDSIKSWTDRGAWTALTAYAGKDLVSNGGTWYVCVVAHTSSAEFATDTASKWRVYQGITEPDLAASSGASLVGYAPAGAGAVATTVQAKNRESVSILDFKDATAIAGDWTVALTAAVASLSAGGVVNIPFTGKVKLSAAVPLTSGITIRGVSNVDPYYGTKTGLEQPTYLWQETAATPLFTVGGGVCDVAFENISLGAVESPTAGTTATAGKYGIAFEGTYPASSYRFRFSKVTFYNFERAISVNGLAGAQDWQCDGVKLENVTFFNNTKSVYFNTINADWWHFDTCGWLVPNSGDGVFLDRVGFILFTNCACGPTGAGTSADFIHVSEFYDQVKLDTCQVESMANFIHVDTTTGFVNNTYPIILDNCICEAPSTLERQCRFVSINSRYTESVTASGDDVLIESNGDLFTAGKDFITSGLRPIVLGRVKTWTPVPVPTSGAITSYTSFGQYYREGDKVTASFQINITNVGTASALAHISGLPFDTDNYGLLSVGAGRESGTTGVMWQFYIGPGTTSLINGKAYNNDPGIVTGTTLHGTLTFFADSLG